MITMYRIEIKYGLITFALLGGLVALAQTHAFSGMNTIIDDFFDLMADLSFVGIFIAAVLGNSTVLIQIPHTVLFLPLALGGASLIRMLLMALVAGIGASFGELISFSIAEKILGNNPDLEKSSVFRWVKRMLNSHPRMAPLLVFIWAMSPLPDDTVIIPLAMVRFSMKRVCLPLFTGKVIHNLVTASLFYYFTEQATGLVSDTVQVDLALGSLILFVMVVLYQIEKARVTKPPITEKNHLQKSLDTQLFA